MKVKVYPGKAEGCIDAPASKSVGHRALICAAMAEGESKVNHFGTSKDIEASIEVLRSLGAQIIQDKDNAVVKGCNPFLCGETTSFCNESGSTLRFMIPVFALNNQKHTFTGAGRLMIRPQDIYKKMFDENGLLFDHNSERIVVQGPIAAKHYDLDGSISSQFFTGLLFALPLCKEDSVLHIINKFESRSYVTLTESVLNKFGVHIKWMDDNTIYIPGNQKYTPTNLNVEGDYSAAAFPALLGALNGKMNISNLDIASMQGDKVFFDFLTKMGYSVTGDSILTVEKKDSHFEILDLADCPDLGPACMVLGAFSNEGVKLVNIARLRYKESDRVAAMKEELAKIGFEVLENENEATILPKRKVVATDVYHIDAHNDHRIAMAMAIAGCCLDKPMEIDGAESVAKSYPDFWKDLAATGIRVEVLQ